MIGLRKLSVIDLKDYLRENGYKINTFLSRHQLINYIQTTPKYLDYTKLYNEIIDKPDTFLSEEQQKVFISVFSFLTGFKNRDDIYCILKQKLISGISNLILDYIDYNDYPLENTKIGLLLGGAGTGKTFLVSNIVFKLLQILKFSHREKIIQVLAPTNKAIKVIKQKINKFLYENKSLNSTVNSNVRIHYSTISKFLQQDIEYTKDGKINYKTKINVKTNVKQDEYVNISHVIIDEASMISSKNWKDLNSFIFSNLKHIKVLLIGDECQLPPVNEKTSIVFKEEKYKRFELTEIIRSKSNQLIQIYNLYRDAIKKNKIADIKSTTSKISKFFKQDDFKYINSFNIKYYKWLYTWCCC